MCVFAPLFLAGILLCGSSFSLPTGNGQEENNPIEVFNSDNFISSVSKNYYFIMFYEPNNVMCELLHQKWTELAKTLKFENRKVTLGKIDCSKNEGICAKQNVTNYPTLIFYKSSENGSLYDGNNNNYEIAALTSYINKNLNDGYPSKCSRVTEYTNDTFDLSVNKGNHFIMFYVPWSQHSKELKPIWEKVAEKLKNNTQISIATVNCYESKSICDKHRVRYFPTVLRTENGNWFEYTGERTENAIYKYLNSKLKIIIENQSEETQEVIDLKKEDFWSLVNSKKVLVDFYVPRSTPCKRIEPLVKELGNTLKDDETVIVARVNCVIQESLCDEQEITSYPTLIIYKNGEKYGNHTDERSIREFVEEYIMVHYNP